MLNRARRLLPRSSPLWGAVVLALLVPVAGGASGCSEKLTAEQRVQRALDKGVEGLHKASVPAIAEVLSESYLDGRKRDKRKLKQVAFITLQQGPVWVALRDVKITVTGQNADVTFNAFAMQGKAELESVKDIIPDKARQFSIKAKLLEEDGEWRFLSIDGDGLGRGAGG